jgi:hypothetical protein
VKEDLCGLVMRADACGMFLTIGTDPDAFVSRRA